MSQIESAGVYKARITEHALGTTKVHNDEQGNYLRGGYPNFTAKLEIVAKYIQEASEIAHFKSAGVLPSDEPAWVDYSAYGYETAGFFCLFNSASEFSDQTKILGCDQVMTAVGWTGESFDDLNGDKYVGTEVLIRVENREYPVGSGKFKLDIVWLDHKDASPIRELRKVDDATLNGLNSKLKLAKKAPPKPVAAPVPVPATAAPAPTAVASPSPAAPPAEQAPAPAPAAPAAPVAPAAGTPGGEMTKDEAWAFVHANKGDNDDGAVTDAWMASCAEIADELGTTDETQFTGQHWYKIATNTKKDLGV